MSVSPSAGDAKPNEGAGCSRQPALVGHRVIPETVIPMERVIREQDGDIVALLLGGCEVDQSIAIVLRSAPGGECVGDPFFGHGVGQSVRAQEQAIARQQLDVLGVDVGRRPPPADRPGDAVSEIGRLRSRAVVWLAVS